MPGSLPPSGVTPNENEKGFNLLGEKLDVLIKLMGGLSGSQRTLFENASNSGAGGLNNKEWQDISKLLKKSLSSEKAEAQKTAYDAMIKRFTQDQTAQLKRIDHSIDISKAMLKTYQRQLDLSKTNSDAIDKFIKHMQTPEGKKPFQDNAQAYTKELRGYQDKHFGESLRDLFAKQSPFLQLLTNNNPKAPGSDYKRRSSERVTMLGKYDRQDKSLREGAWAASVLGDTAAADITSQNNNIYTKGMDREEYIRTQGGINEGKDQARSQRGRDSAANNFMAKKAKGNPTESDMMLDGIMGEVGLYLGEHLKVMQEIMNGQLKASEDIADATMLNNQQGLGDKLKAPDIDGMLPGLIAKMVPMILPALGIAIGVAALATIITSMVKNYNKRGAESQNLIANSGLKEEDIMKKTKGDRAPEKVKMAIYDLGGTGVSAEDVVQAGKDSAGNKTADEQRIVAKALAEVKATSLPLENVTYKKVGTDQYMDVSTGKVWTIDAKDRLRIMKKSPAYLSTPYFKTKYPNNDVGFDNWVADGNKFHTGGVVPGKPGTETLIKALPNERILSPAESSAYDYNKNSRGDATIDTTNMEQLLSANLQIQQELLAEMKRNTKVAEDKVLKVEDKPRAVPPSRAFVKV